MTTSTGRFEYNPAATQAQQEIFDKGEYELIIGKPKAFLRKEGEKVKNYGIYIPFIHGEGSRYAGKRGVTSFYLHNDGGQSMTKRFQMAVMGFKATQEGEADFNNASAELDWSFNPETGEVGEGWLNFDGKRVISEMDTKPRDDDPSQLQQVFKKWRPISSE